jgi:predicted dithiol-disulfide oxidoreductase (DUF899 family)
MSLPEIVDRETWLKARRDLLAKEKEFTRLRDELSAHRRGLPMVKIDKPYEFEGPDGKVGLADIFEGRHQLILGHFMFHPEWEDGCPSCTAGAVEVADGLLEHLHKRDTTLAYVSRAPLEKIERYKRKMGWTFPWYSSHGSDFNYDFNVTIDESVKPLEYNFRTKAEFEAVGQSWWDDWEQPFDLNGTSVFLRTGDDVFHTYGTFARGAEQTGGSYYFLDMTALGRQEPWEKPEGRSDSLRSATPNFLE